MISRTNVGKTLNKLIGVVFLYRMFYTKCVWFSFYEIWWQKSNRLDIQKGGQEYKSKLKLIRRGPNSWCCNWKNYDFFDFWLGFFSIKQFNFAVKNMFIFYII